MLISLLRRHYWISSHRAMLGQHLSGGKKSVCYGLVDTVKLRFLQYNIIQSMYIVFQTCQILLVPWLTALSIVL